MTKKSFETLASELPVLIILNV